MVTREIFLLYVESLGRKAIERWAIAAAGEDSLKIRCPFHDDKNPSATVDFATDRFICRATHCSRKTDIATALAAAATISRGQAVSRDNLLFDLSRNFGLVLPDDAPLNADKILAAHNKLIESVGTDPVVKSFLAKGVTVETCRRYKIGLFENRITIPILNELGSSWVNIRSYLPNAPGDKKMLNAPGRGGKVRLYPQDQLAYPSIMFCGGETKALVAAQCLNPHGIGAVCATGSEGTYDKRFNPFFKGKIVYVCFDIDDAGQAAAVKISRLLYRVVEKVLTVALPIDPAKYPTGDINNFVHDMQGNLYDLIKNVAVEFVPKEHASLEELEQGEYEQRTISGAIASANIGKRSAVDATVVGVSEERYSVPKTVRVSCDFNSDHCASCNVLVRRKSPKFAIPAEHPAVIAFCQSSDNVIANKIRNEIIGIPTKCKAHTLVVDDRYGAEIAVLSQPIGLQATADTDTRAVQKALIIGDGIELNGTFRFYARSQPSPITQETVLIAAESERLIDALDATEIDSTDLRAFQPEDTCIDALEARLLDIAADLSANVTKIYQRPDLHRVIDIVSHSPLYMTLEGSTVKGYAEGLIIGDTGQGKSRAVSELSKHYGAGHIIDSANVSKAGLIGGNQQIANMWLTTWGAWPTHDRKWIILEELKRAPVEIIAAITETRSSGIAKVAKIKSGQRNARARFLAVSNTRSDRFLRTYGSGADAVLELIGQPEDVRRFDLCYAVSADDLSGDVVHGGIRPVHAHRYTASLCHNLIKWTWTRTAEQVVISNDVKNVLFRCSQHLSERYVDTIPIVDRGTIRLKLARIACAIACRTYSTTDGVNVDVQERHVLSAYNFLLRIYDSPAMGYKAYSDKTIAVSHMTDVKKAAVLRALKQQSFSKSIRDNLLTKSFINREELQLLGGMAREDCTAFLSVLLRNGCIEFKGANIIVTGAMREFLRTIPESELTDGPEV